MGIITFLFRLLLGGIAFASVIPHLFPNFWLADIFSHFKLQYVILLLLPLLCFGLVFKKSKLSLFFSLILLGWNCWFIVPLYLHDSEVKEASSETLSILAMNLLASNTNYSEALELIREKDPEVVVLLELSPQWEEEMQVFNSEFPYRKLFPKRDNFGIGILSKLPMEANVINFNQGFPPSIHAIINGSGSEISLLVTHPVPPVSQRMFEFRNAQLEEITNLAKSMNGNFIVAGDLNTSSYSTHFQDLLERGDLNDSRDGFGIASTWPTNFLPLRTTLDHFLFKGEIKVLNRTTERNIGSDHLPIYLKIGL